MLDGPGAGLHGTQMATAASACAATGMPGHVRLLDDRAQLAHRVLRALQLVRRRGGPAASHDLDEVGAAPYLVTDRAADLGVAVRDGEHHAEVRIMVGREPALGGRAHVAMPTRLAQDAVADEHPRPGDQPLLDRGPEARVGAAGVADRGVAPVEHVAEAPDHLDGDEAGRVLPGLVAEVDVDRSHVDMGIDEAGQQRPAPDVDPVAVRQGGTAGRMSRIGRPRQPARRPRAGRHPGRR